MACKTQHTSHNLNSGGVCAHRLGCILRAQRTFAVDLQFESWALPTQLNLVARLWAVKSEGIMHHKMYGSALGPEPPYGLRLLQASLTK